MSWGFEAASQPGGDKSPRHRVCVGCLVDWCSGSGGLGRLQGLAPRLGGLPVGRPDLGRPYPIVSMPPNTCIE